jgi:hypothetical protein
MADRLARRGLELRAGRHHRSRGRRAPVGTVAAALAHFGNTAAGEVTRLLADGGIL